MYFFFIQKYGFTHSTIELVWNQLNESLRGFDWTRSFSPRRASLQRTQWYKLFLCTFFFVSNISNAGDVWQILAGALALHHDDPEEEVDGKGLFKDIFFKYLNRIYLKSGVNISNYSLINHCGIVLKFDRFVEKFWFPITKTFP